MESTRDLFEKWEIDKFYKKLIGKLIQGEQPSQSETCKWTVSVTPNESNMLNMDHNYTIIQGEKVHKFRVTLGPGRTLIDFAKV